MGAVPRAEMIDVRVEKLFMARHFCKHVSPCSKSRGRGKSESHVSDGDEMLDHNDPLLHI